MSLKVDDIETIQLGDAFMLSQNFTFLSVLSLLVAGTAAADDTLAPEWEAERVSKRPIDAEAAQFVPGKGLEIASVDGDFKLQTRLRAQYLYQGVMTADEDAEHYFMIRRARLQFSGNMWGKNNKFKAEIAISPRDDSFEGVDFNGDDADDSNLVKTTPLLDWYQEFTQIRDLNVRIGQYKVPYSRQRVISSGNLQLVDRSVTSNAEFTLDRDLGIDIRSKDLFGLDLFKYYAGVYIGEGRNTSNKTIGAGDQGLMYIARVEVLPFGSFKDYSEADLARSTEPGLSIGAAYAYVAEAPKTRGILGSTITDDVWNYQNVTGDLMFKYAGFSLLSEVFMRQGEAESGVATSNGWGTMAQAGYLIPNTAAEITGRYGMNRRIGTETESVFDEGLNEAGGGVGYYFAHHPLKLQADVFRIWNEADGQEAGELMIRSQLQAAF
ncbi:MAG: phosphate-selective porin OprO/OprP [Myxococcota bacterium]